MEERAIATAKASTSLFDFGGDLDRAYRFASTLAQSQIIPDTFQKNPASVLIALDMANRMRRNPLEVMQAMYIVHGKPSFSSSFLISLINSSGFFEPLRFRFQGEDDNRGCMAWTVDKRTGEKVEGPEITIAMAKAEGWYSKSGSKWRTMPDVMLRYRAASFFSRAYCPDLTGGFHSTDEMQDATEFNNSCSTGNSEILQAQLVTTAEVPKTQQINTLQEVIKRPEPTEEQNKDEAEGNGKAMTELEQLREAVKNMLGETGLDLTAGEQAEFLFQHAGESELNKIPKPKLGKVLQEARKRIGKLDYRQGGAKKQEDGGEEEINTGELPPSVFGESN